MSGECQRLNRMERDGQEARPTERGEERDGLEAHPTERKERRERKKEPLTPALSPRSGEREGGIGTLGWTGNPTLRVLSVGIACVAMGSGVERERYGAGQDRPWRAL